MPDSVFLLWLPLGTALIGALAALAGNAISPMFGARSSHEQWLRDKRAERFEEYYVLVGRALQKVEYAHIAKAGHGALEQDMMQDLGDAATSLELYASRTTGDAANGVAEAYTKWEIHTLYEIDPPPKPADLDEYSDDFITKAKNVRALIRAELKVK